MTATSPAAPSARSAPRRDGWTAALWTAGGLVFAFIYLPLAVVIVYAFHDSPIIAWPLRLGTLHWFADLSRDRGMLDAALA